MCFLLGVPYDGQTMASGNVAYLEKGKLVSVTYVTQRPPGKGEQQRLLLFQSSRRLCALRKYIKLSIGYGPRPIITAYIL